MDGTSDGSFEELKALIDDAFPDLRCLRCGNEAFLLASDVDALTTGRPDTISVLRFHSELAAPGHRPVVTLACTRCGYLENHVVGLLERAKKPILKDNADG